MVAEAGDNLGVGEHLGQGLEDKAGRGQVVLPGNGCEAFTSHFMFQTDRHTDFTAKQDKVF